MDFLKAGMGWEIPCVELGQKFISFPWFHSTNSEQDESFSNAPVPSFLWDPSSPGG